MCCYVVSIPTNFKPDLIFFPSAHNTVVTFVPKMNNFKPRITFMCWITEVKPPFSQTKPTFWTKVATVLDKNAPLGRTYLTWTLSKVPWESPLEGTFSEFSAESQKISLLIFGLLKSTETLRCCQVSVLPCFLKKPINNEGKLKVLKKRTIKDRPDDNSPKIAK